MSRGARVPNEERAERGRALVSHYTAEHGAGDDEETLTDILADLMHAYGREAVSKARDRAEMHHEAETTGTDAHDRAERERG